MSSGVTADAQESKQRERRGVKRIKKRTPNKTMLQPKIKNSLSKGRKRGMRESKRCKTKKCSSLPDKLWSHLKNLFSFCLLELREARKRGEVSLISWASFSFQQGATTSLLP